MAKVAAPTGTLDSWTKAFFTHDGETKDIYRKGTGPGIVVIAEIPGIHPQVIGFADRLVEAGFSVVMPRLFGTPGREVTAGYGLKSMVQSCVSREFMTWALDRTSPVMGWMRGLSSWWHSENGGPGVGAIGMCLTGGFALGMMTDLSVVAPVLSQPSLPLPIRKKAKPNIGLSPDDLALVKQRVASGCQVLGMRFTDDSFVPGERFDTLRRELGDGFIAIEIDSSPGNVGGHAKKAHSVVTGDLDDQPGTPSRDALDQMMAFFEARLKA